MKEYLFLLPLCIFCLFIFMTARPEAALGAGSTYYVSSDAGGDSNDGSVHHPWKTIQKAADSVKAGDTVIVRGGIYREKVTMKTSGKANAYITFMNFEGEAPVIDGTGQSASDDDLENGLILIPDKSYIKVVGFSVSNYVSANSRVPAGIRITGASRNIEIRSCKVYGIQTLYSGSDPNRNAYGIVACGTDGDHPLDGLLIDRCEVYDCRLGQSESVVLNGNVTRFTVTDNRIHDNDNIGIDFIGYEGTAPSNDYARNGVCSGNQVWNIGSGSNKTYSDSSADGIYVDGGASITIEGNRVWSSDIGIEAASEHEGKKTDGILVRNNLIYDCRLYGLSIGGSDGSNGASTNIRIFNNTVYRCCVDMNFQEHCQYGSNVVKNNIFYGGTPYAGSAGTMVLSNNVTADPLFVNAGSDFHLQPDSCAVDAGFPCADIGARDLDGNIRVRAGAVDCGCYECY